MGFEGVRNVCSPVVAEEGRVYFMREVPVARGTLFRSMICFYISLYPGL